MRWNLWFYSSEESFKIGYLVITQQWYFEWINLYHLKVIQFSGIDVVELENCVSIGDKKISSDTEFMKLTQCLN